MHAADPAPTTPVRDGRAPGLLSTALAAGPVLLDGGLSTELEARGHDVSSDLWSARVLVDAPGDVVAVHADFAAAGARVLTTASYQATVGGLLAAGLDRAAAERVITSSVALAREGLALAGRAGWVAGSVGPYGAFLAGGQEYTGDYLAGAGAVGQQTLREHHRPHLQLLAAAGADVLACETVPGAAEVEALLVELDALAVPAWVSVSAAVDDDGAVRTRRGEPLGPVLAAAASVGCVLGVGVNCMDPAAVLPALRQAGGVPGGAFGAVLVAYPNSGEVWDGAARAWTGDPEGSGPSREHEGAGDATGVTAWVAAGARLVGGCCRVRPRQTAAMAAALADLATSG